MTNPLIRLMLICAAVSVPSIAAAQEPSSPSREPACIAIPLPSVQGVEGDGTAFGASLRDLVASFLRGPSMAVVALEARLASHAAEEARAKECRHILSLTLTRKSRAGGGNAFGRAVGHAGTVAAWGVPVSGVGGVVARSATIATTQAISELASSTRARDEVRLQYTLTTTLDGKTVLGPKAEMAKAKSDGEDLLTPLVERAAAPIAAVAK